MRDGSCCAVCVTAADSKCLFTQYYHFHLLFSLSLYMRLYENSINIVTGDGDGDGDDDDDDVRVRNVRVSTLKIVMRLCRTMN